MIEKKSTEKAPKVMIEIPDLGLTSKQITCLKKVFENALVATLGGAPRVAKKKKYFPPKTIVQKKPTPKEQPPPRK